MIKVRQASKTLEHLKKKCKYLRMQEAYTTMKEKNKKAFPQKNRETYWNQTVQ